MSMLEEPAGNEGIKARVSAIKIVAQWMETGDFPDRQLSFVAPVCRGFAMDLVYTTLRNVRLLDSIVSEYITRTPNDTVMAAIAAPGYGFTSSVAKIYPETEKGFQG